MKDTPRIFGAFVVAIALFAFWPVVIGGWAKVRALNVAVAERQKLHDDRKAILDTIEPAYNEYQQKLAGANGEKFASLVPVRKSTAELLSAMQAIAQNSGVQLGTVTFGENERGTPSRAPDATVEQFQSLTLSLGLDGPYAGMRQFLVGLEEYTRILRVDSIDIGTLEAGGQLTFTIQATAYFLR